MKQVVQSYKTGEMNLFDVPVPTCKSGGVLVKNVKSLISIGTEKSMIDMAKKSLLEKARARPDLVKRLLEKARKEGLMNVYKEAINRLDEPVALGYSSAGIVVEVGLGVVEFKIGDRVACVGAGFASHADVIWVPENLCVKLPDNVDFQEAAFAMLGGIALQGIRVGDITFGENVVVIGLGLLGLLTVQILEAYGCEVIGVDLDESKVKLAKEFGIRLGLIPDKDDILSSIESFTKGHGADSVIITASSKDNAPLELAENICRKKGRIVLVGVADISLTRKNFWDKELSFTVSKAAGPGSTEPLYEQAGYDYPIQYVRWTEKRNLEQFISLLSRKKVNTLRLLTHTFKVDDALKAYDTILGGKERCIGVLLDYPQVSTELEKDRFASRVDFSVVLKSKFSAKNVGLIGGGMFTKNVLLPAVSKVEGINFTGVATTTGISAQHIAKKYGFRYCTSNYREILEDKETDSVIITTRHNLHAKFVIDALQAGKNVFVEKPLCLKEEELIKIIDAYNAVKERKPRLMVGFNRRYSSVAVEAKSLLGNKATPLVMIYRVNAGFIPADHWTQDMNIGGGRLIGEVCHFVDFLQFISDSFPVSVFARSISGERGKYLADDNVIIDIGLADGSIGSIIYAACGSKVFPRERIEVFGNESAMLIDDFKSAVVIRSGKERKIKKMSQDMGYVAEIKYFLNPEGFESEKLVKGYVYSAMATFKAMESLKSGISLKIKVD